MSRVTIQGDTAKILSETLGGTPVAALKEWFDFAKGQKNVVASSTGGITTLEVNSDDTTREAILLALSEGFTVEGAPIFIKMTTAKYGQDVPVDISNRSYVNESDETVIRKWSEWKDATHHHMDAVDGDKIVPGNSWGVELSSAELTKLLSLTGYTLYLGHEVNALLPEVEGV